MSVYSIFVISESGSLQFYYDHNWPRVEVEHTFHAHPLPFQFKEQQDNNVLCINFILDPSLSASSVFPTNAGLTGGGSGGAAANSSISSSSSGFNSSSYNTTTTSNLAANNSSTTSSSASGIAATAMSGGTGIISGSAGGGVGGFLGNNSSSSGGEANSAANSVSAIRVGHCVLEINGVAADKCGNTAQQLALLNSPDKFPLTIKFGKPSLSLNERIFLSSMFHSLHRISRSLNPYLLHQSEEASSRVGASSGIQTIEIATFRLHCLESKTGVKFLLITDATVPVNAREALKRVREYYCDFVLKHPDYEHNQPIHFDFFSRHVKSVCEQIEKKNYMAVI